MSCQCTDTIIMARFHPGVLVSSPITQHAQQGSGSGTANWNEVIINGIRYTSVLQHQRRITQQNLKSRRLEPGVSLPFLPKSFDVQHQQYKAAGGGHIGVRLHNVILPQTVSSPAVCTGLPESLISVKLEMFLMYILSSSQLMPSAPPSQHATTHINSNTLPSQSWQKLLGPDWGTMLWLHLLI